MSTYVKTKVHRLSDNLMLIDKDQFGINDRSAPANTTVEAESGGTIITYAGAQKVILNKTDDYQIEASEAMNNYVFTNIGANKTIILTVPNVSAGLMADFINTNQGLVLQINVKNSQDSINFYGVVSASGVYNGVQGAYLKLIGVDNNRWFGLNCDAWNSIAVIGLFGGGDSGAVSNVIDKIQISTLGNATLFGTLSVARAYLAGFGSNTRGIWGGGFVAAANDTVDYAEISTDMNAVDFGNLSVTRYFLSGCSNKTRGLFAGGFNSVGARTDTIDYVEIATKMNCIDFGNLNITRDNLAACGSDTRALFAGGDNGTYSSVIDYVAITTLGNAGTFGSLSQAREDLAGCASNTRAVFAGGSIGSNVYTMDWVTIATLGTAASFGSLSNDLGRLAACSSWIRGVFGGGNDGGVDKNMLYYVTIETQANSKDFGTLTLAREGLAGLSNGHGGIL